MDDKLLHEALLTLTEAIHKTYLLTLESHNQNPSLKGKQCTTGLDDEISKALTTLVSNLEISLHELP